RYHFRGAALGRSGETKTVSPCWAASNSNQRLWRPLGGGDTVEPRRRVAPRLKDKKMKNHVRVESIVLAIGAAGCLVISNTAKIPAQKVNSGTQSPYAYSQRKAGRWEQYSASYKKNRDYKSLKALVKLLKIGMPQRKVEDLLGEPDYSPIEGQ